MIAFCNLSYPDQNMGLPRPLPAPGLLTGLLSSGVVDLAFLMDSSTERMRQQASLAALNALILTRAGSHTKAAMLSAMSSFIMSTPYHIPPAKGQLLVRKLKKIFDEI